MERMMEESFIALQTKTTHVLIDQRVVLTEQDKTDIFLDKINDIKSTHSKLIPEYAEIMDKVASFLQNPQPIEQLILISESLNNLVGTTKRLTKSLGEGRLRSCFIAEMEDYKNLVNDINKRLDDIQNLIVADKEMEYLLNSL
jgi:hypothetical protein